MQKIARTLHGDGSIEDARVHSSMLHLNSGCSNRLAGGMRRCRRENRANRYRCWYRGEAITGSPTNRRNLNRPSADEAQRRSPLIERVRVNQALVEQVEHGTSPGSEKASISPCPCSQEAHAMRAILRVFARNRCVA
uniref:Uncharacterized protein n=1 Tax=Polymyxa graminis TaxID=70182 RepID=Q8T319_9EUKA|nr:hypothetical protein [Polymyxa graminis]